MGTTKKATKKRATPKLAKAQQSANQRATWLQCFIFDHFDFDVAHLTRAETLGLAEKLREVALLKDMLGAKLKPVDELSFREIKTSGYKP